MRYLLIMRHAKSDWSHSGLADHDRPLNARGERDAPRMGRWLQSRGCVPEHIAASTALRARKTADLVAGSSGFGGAPVYLPELYLAGPATYIEWAVSLDDQFHRALAIGHNPGVEELVSHLTGEAVAMPTAAVAVLRIESERWEDFALNPRAQLESYWKPKGLPREFE